MSLLNDVLRDLERRDAGPGKPPPPPTAPTRRPLGAGRLLAGALLAALAVAAVVRFGFRPAEEPRAHASAPTTPEVPHSAGSPTQSQSIASRAKTSRSLEAVADESGMPREPAAEPVAEPVMKAAAIADESGSTSASDDAPAPDDEPPEAESLAGASPSSLSAPEAPMPAEPPPAAPAESTSENEDRGASRISIERVGEPDASSVRKARRALGQGRIDRAATLLGEAIESGSAGAEAYLMLARLRADRGRIDAAIDILERGRKRFDDDRRFVPQQARILLAAGRAGAAATLLANDPPPATRSDHYLVWAAALRRLDRYDDALARYDAVLASDPAHGRAWLGRALTLESLGRPADARSAYQEAERRGDAETARFARWRSSALLRTADQRKPEEEPR